MKWEISHPVALKLLDIQTEGIFRKAGNAKKREAIIKYLERAFTQFFLVTDKGQNDVRF